MGGGHLGGGGGRGGRGVCGSVWAMAGSFMRYALAMRERLPRVAAVFRAGDIDYRLFQTIVYRTDLITDAAVLAAVDGELAVRASRWPSMTRGQPAGEVDKIVAKADVDAVRRREQCRAERGVWIEDLEGGMSEIHGSVFGPDAHAVDKRLDALADTVCERDPRSRDQRRADALGALAAGADRLGCRLGARLRGRKTARGNAGRHSCDRRAGRHSGRRVGAGIRGGCR